MSSAPDDWSPSPELLAAYFDGELAGRPERIALHRRIADWLRRHPEARDVLDDYRRLAQLWQETIPPDPGPAAWRELEAHLDQAALAVPTRSPRRTAARWTAALAGLAAAIALAVWLGMGRRETPDLVQVELAPPFVATALPSVEVFPVATAAEITILRVEGADTQTLVVGELPVRGPLELAGPGEVALTSVQPDARDHMMPHVRMDGQNRPLIWARVDAEATEP